MTDKIWMDAGDGILREAASDTLVQTSVVQEKDFGRIFEVFDYSNEPLKNLRLILAAPEAIAVLEEFVDDCGFIDDLESDWPDLYITFLKAKKVLAKAKGQHE